MAKTKKARIYYGNEENAFECEFTEYKSLEEAKKDFPIKTGKSVEFKIHYTEDDKGYREIYALAVQGNYRAARQPIDAARGEIVAMFR